MDGALTQGHGGGLTLVGARLPGRAGAVDVVVAGGVVQAVRPSDPGERAAAGPGERAAAGPGERIDAEGRWLLPGFWDEHVHFADWAAHTRQIDISAATSAAQVARIAAEAAIGQPHTEPLVMVGFRDGLWPDLPHRDLLDAAAPGLEVVAISGDLHCAWLNSVALARVGRADHPTGLLREDDWFDAAARLRQVPDQIGDEWVIAAARAAAARGVVGIVDLEMSWSRADWLRRRAAGMDSLRVECGFYPPDLERAVAAGGRTGDPVEGDPLIRVGPLKVIVDGSLNTRTAWCFEPYPGQTGPDCHGVATVSPDELRPAMARAAAAGLTPAIHAIGDQANAMVLDAFEAVGCAGRIEHAQLLRWADIDRMARAGLTASVQPEHAMDDRDVADRHWAGRTDRAFPLASLLAAGVPLALGSDAPVAVLDPWVSLAAAVDRSRDGRPPWHPEQQIGVRDAIVSSARGLGEVAVGMVADLQLIERDPLAASGPDLRTMPVAATFVAGRRTH